MSQQQLINSPFLRILLHSSSSSSTSHSSTPSSSSSFFQKNLKTATTSSKKMDFSHVPPSSFFQLDLFPLLFLQPPLNHSSLFCSLLPPLFYSSLFNLFTSTQIPNPSLIHRFPNLSYHFRKTILVKVTH